MVMAGKALFLAAAALCGVQAQNNRPIIGILTLPNGINGYTNQGTGYFPASYVKWLESAGARVVPLSHTASAAETKAMLQNLNGALFTGGGADLLDSHGNPTQFTLTAQIVFNESLAASARGEIWPLWGTCLGHELISFLASNMDPNILSGPFDSENYTVPIQFTAAAGASRMYGALPAQVVKSFATQNITMNNHVSGVDPKTFAATPAIASRFTVLSTNVDRVGKPFVSSMEGKAGINIFSAQYHPEKPVFEWWSGEVMNHSYDSVLANHYLSFFFVNQARKNYRRFPSAQAESSALIYNYSPLYTGLTHPDFEQCYFFQ